MLAIASFIGMGDVASKDAFEWVMSDPKMVRGSKLVGRLMDDIVSRKVQSPPKNIINKLYWSLCSRNTDQIFLCKI